MSAFNDLLTNAQATVEGLNLLWGQNTAQVVIASQPLNREGTDPSPLPAIYVTPSVRPEGVEQGATGGYMDASYRIELTIVAGGNGSFETNLPTYLAWRESLRKAFQRVHYGSIAGFWGVKATPKEVLNRDLQRDSYDFSVLEIEFFVLEKATA